MTKREKCRTAFVLFWTVLNLGSKLPSPKELGQSRENWEESSWGSHVRWDRDA